VNKKNMFNALTAVVLLQLVWVDAASAFSFCFSFGGGGNHRERNHYQQMPAVGFNPGYWQGYPHSPVPGNPYAAPSTVLPAGIRDVPGMSTPGYHR
jgi:hypothetical protein